ncbi:MAG: hypothetical protein Q4B08_12995, partial [Propionibacteriaceae bacterium]|nr:hypothetical protein [Propionibacteriaceae bacterium]
IALVALTGVALIVTGLLLPSSPAILVGLGSGLISGSGAVIVRHLYWSRPARRDDHERRLERLRIERRDELKQFLRQRAGWITYLLTLAVVVGSILVFSLLSSLGVVEARMLLVYLGALALFMYLAGIVVFRLLSQRYE